MKSLQIQILITDPKHAEIRVGYVPFSNCAVASTQLVGTLTELI